EHPEQTFDPRYIDTTKMAIAILGDEISVEGWDYKSYLGKKISSMSDKSEDRTSNLPGPEVLRVGLHTNRPFWQSVADPTVVLSIFNESNYLEVNKFEQPRLYQEVY